MSWYRTGTITVTAGSAVVTGAGTDFVRNVSPGEAMIGPDLRVYEVQSVVSATVLTLIGNYAGTSAGGQPFAILPTQSFARDLALGAAELLNTFAAVRDGIGQGLIADGLQATPGLRFSADQDTGIFRLGQNLLAIVAGGMVGAYFGATGMTTPGTITAEGSNGGGAHLFKRTSAQGEKVLEAFAAAAFYIASGGAGSSTATAAVFATNTTTGRSINAGGTINASGADYAEYMTKAEGCGTIAPGDVCGVDRNGFLVRSWADAVRYVVKSTEPAYVGGDSWTAHLPAKPEQGDDEPADAYASRLAPWLAQLEVARQKVDRIAFCGQVPVNVTAETLAACQGALNDGEAVYLIAEARGGGIGAQAVRESDMTLPLYMRRLGVVWAIRDGRPIIDVQHG